MAEFALHITFVSAHSGSSLKQKKKKNSNSEELTVVLFVGLFLSKCLQSCIKIILFNHVNFHSKIFIF